MLHAIHRLARADAVGVVGALLPAEQNALREIEYYVTIEITNGFIGELV
jgi:hypothetical protein